MYEDDPTRRWPLRGSKLPVAACFMLTPIRRHYLLCLERVAALPRGKARRLLLRLRLATADRRRIMPRHLIGPSRPRRIARISPSKTSQSLIFETNTVGVTPLAVNKCSCIFAALIVVSECCSALLNRSTRWISMSSLQPKLNHFPEEVNKC